MNSLSASLSSFLSLASPNTRLQLEACASKHPVHLARVFLDMGSAFMLYEKYYVNYPVAVKLLQVTFLPCFS